MDQRKAKTVRQYLAALTPERREAIDAVRKVILKNLDKGYEECMNYGMIGYVVPHRVYPPGYHCDPSKPLPFGGIASNKHYLSIGFMSTYWDPEEGRWLEAAWKKSGKHLDKGTACIRFKKVEDVPLDVIGELVRRVPAKRMIGIYEAARASTAKPAKKRPARAKPKAAAKK